jgi:hypothetical protein
VRIVIAAIVALPMVCAAGTREALAGQAALQLTTADSARIRLAVVKAIVDTVSRRRPPARIWIESPTEREVASGETRGVVLTGGEWAAIASEYPQARRIERFGRVFDCPEGVTVRMPGSGCPILEGGIIIVPGSMQLLGDSLRAGAVLIQSSQRAQSFRFSTSAQGLTVVFRYVEGVWQTHALRFLWIT